MYIIQSKRSSSSPATRMNVSRISDRAEDAPEQHAVLILQRHAEEGEDHGEHEHVVHRQRPFDQVAGEKQHRVLPNRPATRSRPLKASASVHQKTVHQADSRSVGSCACRWNTNMSSTSSATVPAQKATHSQMGTSNGGTADEVVAAAANNSTAMFLVFLVRRASRCSPLRLRNDRHCRELQQPGTAR